jgi:hypothetical protein
MGTLFTKPYKMSIAKKELTKKKLGAAVKRVLQELRKGYVDDTRVWLDCFAPEGHTHDLKNDTIMSTKEGFINITDAYMGITLMLRSMVPYAEYVNDWDPPINWSKGQQVKYHYFNELVKEITNVIIPKRLAQAIVNEGMT